ncbi:hypothetical protein [Paraliobacillus ryukyuensis]|uniref:hypothetical protein n=1 Tax=Paraliobacillus ryukyuensis TaxID=200904 RepID=UPI0009A6A2D7|nr:hypothetical protein [Paraliobacillus ryukyuensis]
MKPVICKYCHKPIEKRDQLVTLSNYLQIRPYHYVCYQKVEENTKTVWKLTTPLNGITANIRFVLLLLIAGWFLFTETYGAAGIVIAIISLYSIIFHITSYFLFDQRIPK